MSMAIKLIVEKVRLNLKATKEIVGNVFSSTVYQRKLRQNWKRGSVNKKFMNIQELVKFACNTFLIEKIAEENSEQEQNQAEWSLR